MERKQILDEAGHDYSIRNSNRMGTLSSATMALLNKFLDDGDGFSVAKGKILDLSREITTSIPGAKMDYILGDSAALINHINTTQLTFMTNANKTLLINILNPS